MAANYNEYMAKALLPSLGQLQPELTETILIGIISMLEGDGYDCLCQCEPHATNRCQRDWLDAGYVCPVIWNM